MPDSVGSSKQSRRGPRRGLVIAVLGLVIVGVGLYAGTILLVNVRPGAAPPQPPSPDQLTHPLGAVELPGENAPVDSIVTVRGWAVDTGALENSGVDRVGLYLDGASVAQAEYGSSRPDVSARLGTRFDASGWTAQVDVGTQAYGPHQLEARARSALTGADAVYARTVVVTPPPSAAVGALDAPEEGETVSGSVDIRGWAIDPAATEGTGTDRVELLLDDLPLGTAVYGYPRADVAANYGPRFEAVGFQARVDLSDKPAGPHRLEARAHSVPSGQQSVYARTVVVALPPSAPRGALDVPVEGAAVSGLVDVRGWAIDAGARTGTGVNGVQLFLDGTPIGEARYGYARADVAAAYGTQFEASGFSMQVDLRATPAGAHQLEARSRSEITGTDTAFTRSIEIGGAPE